MNVRTSATHPLRIDWLEMPPGWRVGITIAPGKRTVSTEGFLWERDLDADLDVIVREGVRTLVCLLESDEMARLGVADLVDRARDRGLHTIHAPIRDVSVPADDEASRLIERLMEAARGPIVIHCNGGLGRSGVVGGILLRALGITADETLQRLSKARGPRCPETAAQRELIVDFTDGDGRRASVTSRKV